MTPSLPAAVAVAVVVVACAVTDLRRRSIRNAFNYPALAAGLALGLAGGGTRGLGLAAAGAAVGFFPALVAYLAGGLGGGDVKLLAAVGALVGPLRVIEVTFVACVLSLAHTLVSLALRGLLWRALATAMRAPFRRLDAEEHTAVYFGETPFGPALALATLLSLVSWYALPGAGALLGGLP